MEISHEFKRFLIAFKKRKIIWMILLLEYTLYVALIIFTRTNEAIWWRTCCLRPSDCRSLISWLKIIWNMSKLKIKYLLHWSLFLLNAWLPKIKWFNLVKRVIVVKSSCHDVNQKDKDKCKSMFRKIHSSLSLWYHLSLIAWISTGMWSN